MPVGMGADSPAFLAPVSPAVLQVFGCRKKMSAIAILDYSGAEGLFKEMEKLADQGRQEWEGHHQQVHPVLCPCPLGPAARLVSQLHVCEDVQSFSEASSAVMATACDPREEAQSATWTGCPAIS